MVEVCYMRSHEQSSFITNERNQSAVVRRCGATKVKSKQPSDNLDSTIIWSPSAHPSLPITSENIGELPPTKSYQWRRKRLSANGLLIEAKLWLLGCLHQYKRPSSPKDSLHLLLFLFAFGLFVFHCKSDRHHNQQITNVMRLRTRPLTPILVKLFPEKSKLLIPSKTFQTASPLKDYGGLVIWILQDEGVPRSIFRDFELDEGETTILQRNREKRDDDVEDYYAYDDDVVRNQYFSNPKQVTLNPQGQCRRTNWHSLVFPTCNVIHELAMESPSNFLTYLSYGAYRDVYTLEHQYLNARETVAIKQIRSDLKYKYDNYEFVRVDALISERLTSSPKIADIYTHCGIAMVVELFPRGDIEKLVTPTDEPKHVSNTSATKDNLESANNLTSSEKLQFALQMAQGIAALHGFPDGMIVHNDVQPAQFLIGNSDEHILKLSDFNRAEIMLWDEEHQEYCRYRNGFGQGNYRSPEEYWDKPLDEKIDVWSFGNNLFALLTGRYPFYTLDDDESKKTNVKNGAQQVVDPRYRTKSFADGKLVDLIERCWEYDPAKRANIFELVEALQKALDENEHVNLLPIV